MTDGGPRRWRLTLRARLWLLALLTAAVAAPLALLVEQWTGSLWAARGLGIAGGALAGALVLERLSAPALSLFRALAGTVSSYRDGDFGFDVAWEHDDELRELVQAHNALGQTLREQRLGLAQRELMLDSLVQQAPVAMLLVDDRGRVVFGNVAARRLMHGGRLLEGARWDELVAAQPGPLAQALAGTGDGLATVTAGAAETTESDGDDLRDDSFHVSRKDFVLGGRPHRLWVVRPLGEALRRQEVRTWKRVIRVVGHELNNSLAPIGSMAHSAQELLKRGEHERLAAVLQAVQERARHLEVFVRGYADVAKLPAPRPEPIAWQPMVQRLRAQVVFGVDGRLPDDDLVADPTQLEQALINLLKNAHESGSAPADVTLAVRALPGAWRIEVRDRGQGMDDAVMEQAMLPFYSTKRDGSGLGLALVREIAEAHRGRLALARREGGGLAVVLTLPA